MRAGFEDRLTNRAVAVLTRLAEHDEGAVREWVSGLLAEVEEVPAGAARLRWVLGGIRMLVTGAVCGRRDRLVTVARRPARWSQRLLTLPLLHAFFLLVSWVFAQEYRPRGLAFHVLAVALLLAAVLAWWRPVPAMLFGMLALTVETALWLAPGVAVVAGADGETLAALVLGGLALVAYGVLPLLTLMASIVALSAVPPPPRAGDHRARTAAARALTVVPVVGLLGLSPWPVDLIAARLNPPTGDPAGIVLGVALTAAVPGCVLLASLAELSRPAWCPVRT